MNGRCLKILLFSGAFCSLQHLNAGQPTDPDSAILIDQLSQAHFENIRLLRSNTENAIYLEAGTWRSFSDGAENARDEISRIISKNKLNSLNQKTLRLVLLDQGIPSYAYLRNAQADSFSPHWKGTFDPGISWKYRRNNPRKNSNNGSIDLVVYPQYAIRNQRKEVPAEYYLALGPTLQWQVWSGMKVYAQVLIPIINEFGYEYSQVRQGNISAHQQFRFENIFGEFSVGCFTKNRWGADLELSRPMASEGIWSNLRLIGRAGYTGSSYFRNWYWHVGTVRTLTWEVGADFFAPWIDTRFDVRIQKYLANDLGIRAEAIRYFKRACIGAYAARNQEGGMDGGFLIAFQFPVHKQTRWKNRYRICPPVSLDYEYNGAAFFYLGKRYSTYPGDRNAFTTYKNPLR